MGQIAYFQPGVWPEVQRIQETVTHSISEDPAWRVQLQKTAPSLGQSSDYSARQWGKHKKSTFKELFWNLTIAKPCLTLCDSIDCSIPGFSVLHYLSEFAQIHVQWVADAIQPSHPLSPSSSPALNLSQHQGIFQWLSSSHQVAKLSELQFQHQFFWRRKQNRLPLESRTSPWARLWTLSYMPSICGNDIPTGKPDPSGWKSTRAHT